MLALLRHLHDKERFALTAPSRTWACLQFKQYLYQRIAIAFWSGVAAMERTRNRINATAEVLLRP